MFRAWKSGGLHSWLRDFRLQGLGPGTENPKPAPHRLKSFKPQASEPYAQERKRPLLLHNPPPNTPKTLEVVESGAFNLVCREESGVGFG